MALPEEFYERLYKLEALGEEWHLQVEDDHPLLLEARAVLEQVGRADKRSKAQDFEIEYILKNHRKMKAIEMAKELNRSKKMIYNVLEAHGVKLEGSGKKAVYQFSVEGKLLNRYESMKEASERTGISVKTIQDGCRKKTKGRKFIWRYAE